MLCSVLLVLCCCAQYGQYVYGKVSKGQYGVTDVGVDVDVDVDVHVDVDVDVDVIVEDCMCYVRS